MSKITICKYCQSKDVFWEKTPEGKWYLSDMTGGLPHACDQAYNAALQRKAEYKTAKEQQNAQLKDTYYKKKAELDANSKMSSKDKSRTLYLLRKQLWPSMFNKNRIEPKT